jgi:hypothetical protein
VEKLAGGRIRAGRGFDEDVAVWCAVRSFCEKGKGKMGSKMVVDKQKSAESVQAALETFKGAMVAGIGAVLGTEAEAAAGLLLDKAAVRLKESTDAMVAADDAHLKELSDDTDVLSLRDEKAADVYSNLVEFREIGAAVYGDPYMHRLGFDGNTPQDPTAVERLAGQVLSSVKEVAPPSPRRPGLSLDANDWTLPLTESRKALSEAISAAAREKREADATLVAKNAAMDNYDKVFSITATMVSSMLSFAGQKELARRVRPSSRRSGQTAESAEPEENADAQPAAG